MEGVPLPPFRSYVPSDVSVLNPRTTERYSNLWGISDVVFQVREIVEYRLLHPKVFRHLGVNPPCGVLLRVPPGCGKTHLANSLEGYLGSVVSYFCVSSPKIVMGVLVDSESRIRNLFLSASKNAPSVVFIDKIDTVAPKRRDRRGG